MACCELSKRCLLLCAKVTLSLRAKSAGEGTCVGVPYLSSAQKRWILWQASSSSLFEVA